MLGEVEYDLSMLTILDLLALVSELPEYGLEELRIPYDDKYDSRDEILVPDFEATIEKLHEELGLQAGPDTP